MASRDEVVARLAEVFRTHGYEGASLARIGAGTGLGKGSMYNFFPGGKEEMAQAVMAHIDAWFRSEVFNPLRATDDSAAGVARMLDAVELYFRSGRSVCLLGVFALGYERDLFAQTIRAYFAEWIAALAAALQRGGHVPTEAVALAEETVGTIQGALVLARAADDAALFTRVMARLRLRLGSVP
ncbi:TetR/AcrR family transcriptional regulator [Duganella phyllosphaerae]|uniref:Putative HTH-type transcriptional regulator YxaF n=1 Tax=Duganella phyllosphaerae TaxID=762836 RepID=A0A1E7W8K1_9BURK|nr:TetR/AcrR family transcriptional regulator [Duganella phyllosphaerae]OEZ92591.1 putative HTH-type transcriptional regulator YxaF [Duganella phyllosphaerae]